jgi:hypothetical protein
MMKVFPDLVARSRILKISSKIRHLLCGDILKLFYLLFGDRVEVNWLVVAIRADKTCA